jgi:hypothetical protein
MEINIKPEEIDLYVKNAIIESSIGKILHDSAKKWIDELCSNRYDSPIKNMIHNIVRDMLKEEINKPENLALIKEAFISKINESTINSVIYKLMDKIGIESEQLR